MNEKLTPKYINPMVDFGFKKIFKESGKKQLLIRPLNEIFGLDIVDINIRESEQIGLVREAHRVSYDLLCTDTGGNRFIVEVQLADQKFFQERALFYTAVPIAKSMPKRPAKPKKKKDQVKKKRFRWNYNYPPVFFLALLNFDLPRRSRAQRDPEQYIHLFSLRDEQTGELMTDRLRFAFLEVARFDKTMEQCQTFEERFLFIMKNLPTFVETPELWADGDPYFQELLQEAEFANMTDRQLERYLARMMPQWDYENAMDYAKEKGKAEGKAEGEAKGEAKRSAETARLMLADHKPMDEIVKYSGLTEEQIRAL